MRLIDLDNAKVKYLLGNLEESGAIVDELLEISDAEPIDSVPVVRCKDCKYGYDTRLCNFSEGEDWFCACGERRSE